jgi:adenylate cyclase
MNDTVWLTFCLLTCLATLAAGVHYMSPPPPPIGMCCYCLSFLSPFVAQLVAAHVRANIAAIEAQLVEARARMERLLQLEREAGTVRRMQQDMVKRMAGMVAAGAA